MNKRIGILLSAVLALGVLTARAYDLVVTARISETDQKLIDIPLSAHYPGTYSFISRGELNAADSTFHFRGLPDEALLIMYELDGNVYSSEVPQPVESKTIYISSALLPQSLQEIVVVSDNNYIADDKTVFTPTSRQKRISADGLSLINNMAIAQVAVSPIDGKITTPSGQDVETFIDYRPASPEDVANLRTADVRRVEFFDHPNDIRFRNAPYVINFVLVKYEYGGYTKLTGSQEFAGRDYGDYSAYSKMSYKRMIYDITGGYNYRSSRHDGSDQKSSYVFPTGTVDYTRQLISSLFRKNSVYGTMRAIYDTNNTSIQNTVGIVSTRKPHNDSRFSEKFSSPEYISGEHDLSSNSSDLTAKWEGGYFFSLPRNYSLNIQSYAYYSRFTSNSVYQTTDYDVVNDGKDKNWAAGLWAGLSKSFGRHSVTITAMGMTNFHKMNYYGTSPAYVTSRLTGYESLLIGNFSLGKVYIRPIIGISYLHNKNSEIVMSQVFPQYSASVTWPINNRSKLTFDASVQYPSNSTSELAPNIVVQDQINAVKGNPDLKRGSVYRVNFRYEYMPINNLSTSAFAQFFRNDKNNALTYQPMPVDDRYVMLRSPISHGFINYWMSGISVAPKLFDGKLTLRGSLTYYGITKRAENRIDTSYLTYSLSGTFSTSNFYATATYYSRGRDYSMTATSVKSQFYNLRVGWSNGDLNLSGTVYNPFQSSYLKETQRSDYPLYHTVYDIYSTGYHRSFEIKVVYSIGYGKKVNRSNEASAIEGGSSGLLK